MRFVYGPLFDEAGEGGGGGGGGAPQTLFTGGEGGSPAPGGGEGQRQAASNPWFKDDAGNFADGWHSRLSGDLKDNASLKVIPGIEALAKSYIETKRLVGTKLEAPGENATPEQLANWRKIVGVPEKPEAYLGDAKTLRPEVIPENMWDAEAEKGFLALAHKHHLTPAAVKEIIGFHANGLGKAIETSNADHAAHLAQEIKTLKGEWGDQFDAQVNIAARTFATAGLDPKTHPAFAHSDVVRAFAKLGKMFNETSLVPGEPTASGGIQNRINEIQDPSSTATVAREYRGEFGPERQQQAAEALRALYKAKEAE